MGKPKIRFKGFDNDWEQRKVGDITKELSEYAKLNSGLPLLTSARTGLMYQSDYRGNSTTDNENTLFSIVPLNACTYRHMSDDSTFHINVNTLEKGLVSKEYPVFVENESDLRFVVQYINSSDSFTKFCTEQKKGGTRTRLYYKTLCEYKMLIPSLNEQHIIADYFDNLDYLIALHQRKCEDTKKLKKYMLQKMFPQNGSKVPEIRFKGFTDDWEQRKFGSLLDETKNKTSVEDEDTLLSCAINGMYLNSELFSHFRGASNVGYLKVKKNDLILSAQNLHLGNCNVNLRFEHGIISPAYKVYELVDCNPLFMQAWIKRDSTKNFFLRASTEGASVCRKNIVWEELYKQELLVPDIEEQKKIGAYFDYLDHLITLHQNKCEELKKIKKYMLQNMFV